MSSLTASQEVLESSLWEPLPWLSVKDGFQEKLMIPWLRAQSEVPFYMWHRPSEKTITLIQQKTKTASVEDFYCANTGHSKTRTKSQGNKKPYQLDS
eukprot:10570306-Ditylum_brightwellii.AAC.1